MAQERDEYFGSLIKPDIFNVLLKREEIAAKDVKTQKDRMFLNSRAPWVQLRSSVDVNGNRGPAENFILTGGSTTRERGLRQGLSRQARNNFSAGGQFAYNNTVSDAHGEVSRGIRPMPGITNCTVESYSTYGTLLKGRVEFQVWSLEDLEVANQIYLRPGFTVLLEFGHTYYLNRDGSYSLADQGVPDDKFFASSDFETIERLIQAKRESSHYNYEGMLGFVTNYNWTFNDLGGYDCSLEITSRNVVLESLKSGNVNGNTETTTGENKDEEQSKNKSMIHLLCDVLEEYDWRTKGTVINSDTRTYKQTLTSVFESFEANPQLLTQYRSSPRGKSLPDLFDVDVAAKITEVQSDENKKWFGYNASTICYIPLVTFLDWLNEYMSIYTKSGSGPHTNLFVFQQEDEAFRTFPGHFCIDPLSAVYPAGPRAGRGTLTQFDIINTVLDNSENRSTGTESGYVGRVNIPVEQQIGNIHISTFMLRQIADEVFSLDVDEDKVSIFTIVRSLCSRMNVAFGNVNDFGLHYDQHTQTYAIVDRGRPSTKTQRRRLTLTGKRSVYNNIQAASQITDNLKAMITIAAQGNNNGYAENNTNILNWNDGLTNRHNISQTTGKAIGNSETPDSPPPKFDTITNATLEEITKAYNQFNTQNVFDPEVWANFKSSMFSIFNQNYFDHIGVGGNDETAPIPVTLSFDTIGIGGLKVATCFQIERAVVPEVYYDWAYLITKVNHNINNEGWTTTFNTQFYKPQKG